MHVRRQRLRVSGKGCVDDWTRGHSLEGARGTWAPVTCLGPIQPSVSTCAARQPLILARAEFLRLFAKKRAEFVRAQLHANSCESFVASHFRPPHFFSENFVV
jgi:hypothetical protein